MDSEARRLSPDDVVSFNLRRAREVRGWTQPEAAAHISYFLGREWSAQVYGDAERAYRSARVKIFSAEEIVAFCRAFRLPVVWFYLPPEPWTAIAPRGASESAGDTAMTGDDLLALIFPPVDDPMRADLQAVTDRLFTASAGQGSRRDNLSTFLGWRNRVGDLLLAPIISDLEELEQLPGTLESAADRLRKAIALVADDIRHEGTPAGDGPEGEKAS